MTMDNHTSITPLKYKVGFYEVDLKTFEIQKHTHVFNKLDPDSKQYILKQWLGDKND